MTMSGKPPPPNLQEGREGLRILPGLRQLPADLRTRGYTLAAVLERLGVDRYRAWEPDETGYLHASGVSLLPKAIEYASEPREGDALELLIRLLLLNIPVPRADAERLLGATLSLLLDSGLVRRADGEVQSPLALWECEGRYFVTDGLVSPEPDVNTVMSLMPESYELAQARSRRRVGRTLDLCTGSGVHALLASETCDQAIGVDINPRAVAFAEFNRAMNGIENAAFVEGDLYSAVPPSQPFDLILANPPYAPAADSNAGANFYAGGAAGDAVTARILAGLDTWLAPGGTCQIITLFIDWRGERFVDRVLGFLGPAREEAQVVTLSRELPRDGAIAHFSELNDPETLAANLDAIAWGTVNVRRIAPGEEPFLVELPSPPEAPPPMDALYAALRGTRGAAERARAVRELLGSGP